ncbi:hypothetical protein [Flintibacter muris]|uniref:hypothetical protein n=1 Tax=Flintibacter muris TaxID=2941327 RepID=UPI00203CCD35|nr:hypothetical protein [Flintibacter muris]
MSAIGGIGAIGSYGSISGYYSIYQNRNSYQAYQNKNANPRSTEPVSAVSRAQTIPVQPVDKVPAVQRGVTQEAQEDSRFQFPTIREGADPAEMAVRSRIRYLDEELEGKENELLYWDRSKELEKLLGKNQEQDSLKVGQEGEQKISLEEGEESKSPQEVMEEAECQTCKNRKYQDGSDDPGVSFKTATNVAPEQAAAAVRGHEQEHVVREQAKAQREDRKVVSQSVTIHTDICPECGDVYVSGGTTRTTTKANPVEEPQQQDDVKKSGFQSIM